MSKLKLLVIPFVFLSVLSVRAQNSDSLFIRQIYDEALVNGESYENLRYLCKAIGHRLTGSPEAEEAVQWGKKVLDEMGLDKVYLQPIDIPFWERGEVENARIHDAIDLDLEVTALGGSVGTGGVMRNNVIEVQSLEQLDTLGRAAVEGKFVFYNRPMDPRNINTFSSYGGCVDQRYWGAVKAAEYGAKGVLVRSMTLLENDQHPHTGSMGYKEGVQKIPAVALSTKSANLLHRMLGSNSELEVSLELNCRTNPDKSSHNVIGEITGSLYPEQIIVIGGHLDSWDIGEGAHDDGAGIVHSMEVLRMFKDLEYQPLHTVRVVLFMNEENGNMGGKSYARIAKENGDNHVLAIESDRGGFVPRGYSIAGSEAQVEQVRSLAKLLEPYDLHFFEKGFAGVDISPLDDSANVVNPNILMMGLAPDSQRYFDHHHSNTDVFENVNKRELELGCAAMAAAVYLMDNRLAEERP